MGVKPATEGPAISCDDLGQANLARKGPPQNPTTHEPRKAPRRRLSIGRTSESCTGIPIFYSGRRQKRASLCSPTTGAIEHGH